MEFSMGSEVQPQVPEHHDVNIKSLANDIKKQSDPERAISHNIENSKLNMLEAIKNFGGVELPGLKIDDDFLNQHDEDGFEGLNAANNQKINDTESN